MITSSARDVPDEDAPVGDEMGQAPDRLTHGCAMGCAAILFGAPAAWFYWMVRTFLDGDSWYDFTVRLILDELIVALGLFAAVLIISALFPSPRLTAIVEWTIEHVAKVVLIVFGIMIGSLVLFIFVYAILDTLGVKF